jgi:hypothetical protein
MTSRTTMLLLVPLALGLLASPAPAADPSGIYGLDAGKIAVKVRVPAIVSGNASLPNLRSMAQKTGLRGTMSFTATSGQADNFALGLPPLPLIGSLSVPGVWTTTGSKFTVEIVSDAAVQQMAALLNEALARNDITARVTKRKFVGQVSTANVMKASFALALTVGLPPLSVTISLTGNVSGAYVGQPAESARAASVVAPTARDFLTGFVVDEIRDLAAR